MQFLPREKLPLDHGYYRTSSPVYEKYLWKCGLKTQPLSNNKYGWLKDLRLFQIAKFERVDEEPNIEELRKNGFKHGFIVWVPYSRTQKPKGWRNLWMNSHFTTTGFAVLEDENYFQKWKERAKRARKKFLANPDLRVELVDTDTFQKHYKDAKISQPYKSDFRKYHKNISCFDEKGEIKNMICYYKDRVVAGLSIIYYNGNASSHLVAFLTQEGKTLQAGTGLVDFRFQNGLKDGIKYIHFDHLRDKHMGRDQQGYTDFKENFMDYKVVFEDAYFKII